MRGLTSPLWPIRYKPFPDELLSSWLVRLAHGHGLKVQTFCNLIFGNRRQVWNRDIDRLAPPWLLEELCLRTGTPKEVVWRTTIRRYEGALYSHFKTSGTLQWILVLKMYHRKRQGYGLQFCPICLSEDETPYFRVQWRVALNTLCIRHRVMLLDRCPECGVAVAVHRLDISLHDAIDTPSLSQCHHCGLDLRKSKAKTPTEHDHDMLMLLKAVRSLDEALDSAGRWELGNFEVMRHLCGLMSSSYSHVHLLDFVSQQMGMREMAITPGRVPFESRSVEERHYLLQLTCWLLFDLQNRLSEAWRVGAVRYNVLLKDFDTAPEFYRQMVKRFENWRDRFI